MWKILKGIIIVINDPLIPAKRPDLMIVNKKKRTCLKKNILTSQHEKRRKRKNRQELKPCLRNEKSEDNGETNCS